MQHDHCPDELRPKRMGKGMAIAIAIVVTLSLPVIFVILIVEFLVRKDAA